MFLFLFFRAWKILSEISSFFCQQFKTSFFFYLLINLFSIQKKTKTNLEPFRMTERRQRLQAWFFRQKIFRIRNGFGTGGGIWSWISFFDSWTKGREKGEILILLFTECLTSEKVFDFFVMKSLLKSFISRCGRVKPAGEGANSTSPLIFSTGSWSKILIQLNGTFGSVRALSKYFFVFIFFDHIFPLKVYVYALCKDSLGLRLAVR